MLDQFVLIEPAIIRLPEDWEAILTTHAEARRDIARADPGQRRVRRRRRAAALPPASATTSWTRTWSCCGRRWPTCGSSPTGS